MNRTENERKQILAEAVNRFGRQEWFRDVALYDSHPQTGEPTLEIKVNYIPIFERKKIIEFSSQYNLVERFIVVDKDGKAVE